ncbi:UvrD-helicase domain-containing protein [Bacillus solitudinis]|uniref:UvrD-helicase domain-containing protein n=1 Tax=Bacillus solitudinis TaxID=2014074 RepID=UPI000C2371BC|nr:UvrD-helicase domain-containing protein [Bacillus solitudinis]
MNFNDAQSQAIYSKESLVVISAGAGSGKTRVLTERFIYLCEQKYNNPDGTLGASVEEIVAITFTEKAAREMKDRIRKRLSEKVEESGEQAEKNFWQEQKDSMNRAHVSTFHSFCQHLISQYAMKAELPPRVRVIDDVEAKQMKQEVLTQLYGQAYFVKLANPFFRFMTKRQLSSYLEGIHNEIRELSADHSFQALDAESMLQQQQKTLNDEKRKYIQRFHEQAYRCVNEFPSTEGLTKAQSAHVERLSEAFSNPCSQEDADEYFKYITEMMPKRSDKKWAEHIPSLHELYEDCWKPLKEKWKSLNHSFDGELETIDLLKGFIQLLQYFDTTYSAQKEERGLVDFSDLQLKAVDLLTDSSVQKTCRTQFRHMMIDEFQDTNRLQLDMLLRINPIYQFIVGDTKQSIYRFRGANVRLMNEMEQKATKKEQADSILMNVNYRTASPIIEAVNALFSFVMTTERTETYETVYTPLEAARPPEVESEKRVELLTLSQPDDEEEEELNQYHVLANRMIEMMKSGKPRVFQGEWQAPQWRDMAVLIPARTQLLLLERALTERGIPYVVYGGVGFYEKQEVTDYLTLLRWLNRPFEDVYLLSILRSPIIGLTLEDFYIVNQMKDESQTFSEFVYDSECALPLHIQEAFSTIRLWIERWVPFKISQTLKASLYQILEDTGMLKAILIQKNGMQKLKNVEKLIQSIVDGHSNVLENIIDSIDQRMEVSSKEGESEIEKVDGDVVHIMTVHASKGLEFPIVFLPQVERSPQVDKGVIRFHPSLGIVLNLEELETFDDKPQTRITEGFPIVKEQASVEAKEEAKRLFYVAMTRARDYLFIVGEDTPAKNSWLEMIRRSQEKGVLNSYLIERDEVSDQGEWEVETPIYEPVKVLKQNTIPISFSVSEIMLFLKNREEYYNRYILNMPESFSKRQGVSKFVPNPSKVGTLVHRACELRDYGVSEKLAIEEALSDLEEQLEENRDSYEEAVRELMDTYTEARRQDLGDVVANEWSFSTIIEGAEVIGEIDKIVRKDGSIHLIDFKTNKIQRSGAELLEVYQTQLYLYKLAYEQESGEHVSSMSLYVMRDKSQPIHTLIYNKQEEVNVRKAVKALVKQKILTTSKLEFLSLNF